MLEVGGSAPIMVTREKCDTIKTVIVVGCLIHLVRKFSCLVILAVLKEENKDIWDDA